jgi:hypothetical protein
MLCDFRRRIASKSPPTRRKGRSRRAHVIFLENFFDELRRKAPGGQIMSCCQCRQELPITAPFCDGLAGYSRGSSRRRGREAVAIPPWQLWLPLAMAFRSLRQAVGVCVTHRR